MEREETINEGLTRIGHMRDGRAAELIAQSDRMPSPTAA